MVTSGEAGIDGMPPDECRRGARGRADRVGPDRRRRRRSSSSACRTARSSTASRCGARRRGGPAAPARDRDHRQLPRHLGRPACSTRPTTSRSAGRSSTRSATPATAGSSPSSYDGLEPWGGVREVWAFGSPDGRHAVDTTDTFDAGVASLEAHRAYIEGLGWDNLDPREFLEGFGRQAGQWMGVPIATTAEVYTFGFGDDEE